MIAISSNGLDDDAEKSELVDIGVDAAGWSYPQCLAWIATRDLTRIYQSRGGSHLTTLAAVIPHALRRDSDGRMKIDPAATKLRGDALRRHMADFLGRFQRGELPCSGISIDGRRMEIPFDACRLAMGLNAAENMATESGDMVWSDLIFPSAVIMELWPASAKKSAPSIKRTEAECRAALRELARRGNQMGKRGLEDWAKANGYVGNQIVKLARAEFPSLLNAGAGRPRK